MNEPKLEEKKLSIASTTSQPQEELLEQKRTCPVTKKISLSKRTPKARKNGNKTRSTAPRQRNDRQRTVS